MVPEVRLEATRVFADEELARLREFPEISREELFRFCTLTPADTAFIGRGRGPADLLAELPDSEREGEQQARHYLDGPGSAVRATGVLDQREYRFEPPIEHRRIYEQPRDTGIGFVDEGG
ncbi:hypothetical protein ACW9HH_32655 [Nocardia gipuzkoensis]